MKKLILSIIGMIIVSVSSFAQDEKKFGFSIGPELSFPVGSFSNSHSVGAGGTVQAEYLVHDKLKATATFGVLGYVGKSVTVANKKYSNPAQRIIPLRIGAKYYLGNGVYAGAQLGVAFRSNYAEYSGTAFAYSPLMLGYEFKIKADKALDVTVKYDAYSGSGGTLGAIGFRLAYVF